MMGDPDSKLSDATIGIITALPKEYAAVCTAMGCSGEVTFDGAGAGRKYSVAVVPTVSGGRRIVAVALLTGPGNNAAGIRATLMGQHFRPKHVLLVGIAGAVPNPTKAEHHVRLGDLVISGQGGVVQYDFVKESLHSNGKRRFLRQIIGYFSNCFDSSIVITESRFSPRPPSAELLEAVNLLESERLRGRFPWEPHIDQVIATLGSAEWGRPAESKDRLKEWQAYTQDIRHPDDPDRRPGRPKIFAGTIASANKLLKNPVLRDQLRDKFGARAVEMEASGVADASWNCEISYLVIRGTCDYCNSDKGDDWQKYAAAAAAGYARCLVERLDNGRSAPKRLTPISPSNIPNTPFLAEAELERAKAERIHAENQQEVVRHLLREIDGLRSQRADANAAPSTPGIPSFPADSNNIYTQPRSRYGADTGMDLPRVASDSGSEINAEDAQSEVKITSARFEKSVESSAKIQEPIASHQSDADKTGNVYSERLQRMGNELEFETLVPFVDTVLMPWLKADGDKLQRALHHKLCSQIAKFKLRQARLMSPGSAREVCLAEAELFIEKARNVR
jgi:nucleoside phosphorylase